MTPIPKGASYIDALASATVTRLTDVRDVTAFYAANPIAPPQNNGRSLDWAIGQPGQGWTNSYSKFPMPNANGSLLMAWTTNGLAGVYRASDLAYLGTVPQTAFNSLPAGSNPRWLPQSPQEIIFAPEGGNRVLRQVWNNPASQTVVATTPPGHVFFDSGGEEDLDDQGKYYPVKIATGYSSGFWQNPRCTAIESVNGKVGSSVAGNPNAIDISPDGIWMAYLDHEGPAASEPNRFYKIQDILNGDTSHPLVLDSAITSGVKSIGHNGWSRAADGHSLFVYQDNRDDGYKVFDPQIGKSTLILNLGSALNYPNQHTARCTLPGWAMMSTYGSLTPHQLSNALLMIELATGRIVPVAYTHTLHESYFSEAWASMDCAGQNIYWASNNDGKANLEVYRVAIPPLPIPTMTPTLIPNLAPTLTPTPMPISIVKHHKFQIPSGQVLYFDEVTSP